METAELQQETYAPDMPQPEHRWLDRLIGEWIAQIQWSMGTDQLTQDANWTESVRSLGGLWVLAEASGEMADLGPSTTIMTLGYDPLKKRYVGTWVGSMMSQLSVYEGTLSSDGQTLTLSTEGPDHKDPEKIVQYRDVIEFETDDHRLMRSLALGDDGQWHEFMLMHFWRNGHV